jgi:hypothetical protein
VKQARGEVVREEQKKAPTQTAEDRTGPQGRKSDRVERAPGPMFERPARPLPAPSLLDEPPRLRLLGRGTEAMSRLVELKPRDFGVVSRWSRCIRAP